MSKKKGVASQLGEYASKVSTFVHEWPWIGTFMFVVIFLAIEVPLFHQVCMVLFKNESATMLDDGMDRQYTYLNWVIATVLGAYIGKRLSTKPEVIDAQTRAAQAGDSANEDTR